MKQKNNKKKLKTGSLRDKLNKPLGRLIKRKENTSDPTNI